MASPALAGGAAAHAKAILLADCLEDALTEIAYQAELVGLHSHVSYEDPTGFELSVFGFSAKLVSLAHMMFQARPAPLPCRSIAALPPALHAAMQPCCDRAPAFAELG